MQDNKNYIEREYRQAVNDFKIAHNENERWECRIRMAKLELLACELYGFEYADKIVEMKSKIRKEILTE